MTTDDPQDLTVTARYRRHSTSIRGLVRNELAYRQIQPYVSTPCDVVDVGGGHGEQAYRWARAGCAVTLIDRATDMLAAADEYSRSERPDVAARVSLVEHDGESLSPTFYSSYDLALSHGVLLYLDAPGPMLDSLVNVVRPGGLISIITKNVDALAMRPGLRGNYRGAIEAFDAQSSPGNLGVQTRGDSVQGLTRHLESKGAEVVSWWGIRILSDHLVDSAVVDSVSDLLEAELMAGSRDPYRQVAPLVHVLARRASTEL